MRRAQHGREAGIALVCVSFLIVLCGALGVAFLTIGQHVRAGAAATLQAVQGDLTSASGLQYAVARLWQDPFRGMPPVALPATRCDDWTARGMHRCTEPLGTEPARLLNPSYARGELWIDDGDGLYSLPQPPGGGDFFDPALHDQDGNGRFSVWSGRLRGREGPFSQRYALAVSNAASLVCINNGELGNPFEDHDGNGILNRDDINYLGSRNDMNLGGAGGFPVGNGVKDWRDPVHHTNVPLRNLLDNLGGLLKVANWREEAFAPPPSVHVQGINGVSPLRRTSDLGKIIIENRPQGGYQAVSDLRGILGAEYSAVAPFLTARGERIAVKWPTTINVPWASDVLLESPTSAFGGALSRIDLNTAPREIIEASLHYLTVSGCSGPDVKAPFVRLLPEEATQIADYLALLRPFRSWQEMMFVLAAAPDDNLFVEDPFISPSLYDAEEDGKYRRFLKEDLILAQFDANWQLPDFFTWRRNTLDVPRPLMDPQGRPRARRVLKGALWVTGEVVTSNSGSYGVLSTYPYGWDGRYYDEDVGNVPAQIKSLRCTGECRLTVDPLRWSVSSQRVGGGGAVRVDLDFGGGEIPLRSQNDFEREALPPEGVGALLPGGEVAVTAPLSARWQMHVFPGFTKTSSRGAHANYEGSASNNMLGWLQLGAHQHGPMELGDPRFEGGFLCDEDPAPLPAHNEYFVDNATCHAVTSKIARRGVKSENASGDYPFPETRKPCSAFSPVGGRLAAVELAMDGGFGDYDGGRRATKLGDRGIEWKSGEFPFPMITSIPGSPPPPPGSEPPPPPPGDGGLGGGGGWQGGDEEEGGPGPGPNQGDRTIQQGMFLWWVAERGRQPAFHLSAPEGPPHIGVKVQKSGGFSPYFFVFCNTDAGYVDVELVAKVTGTKQVRRFDLSPFSPDPDIRRGDWLPLGILFTVENHVKPDGRTEKVTRLHLHVRGQQVLVDTDGEDAPMLLKPFITETAAFRIEASSSVDDVYVLNFSDTLLLTGLADRKRYDKKGAMISPQFRIDPANGHDPEIFGLSWDAFMPQVNLGQGLEIRFQAQGGGGGATEWVTYKPGEIPARAFAAPLKEARDVRLGIQMERPDDFDVTPILEECLIYYRTRPKISW